MRHGALSLLFLSENNLLEGLSEKEKYIVLFSVNYHSEKDVPAPASGSEDFEKTAYEFCYVLRDLDKAHLMGESKYHEPKGILVQLKQFYLSDEQKALIKGGEEVNNSLVSLVESYLPESNEPHNKSGIPVEVSTEIERAMVGRVDPQVIPCFKDRKLVPLQLLKTSWSSYLSMRLAMIFDIRNISILKDVLKDCKVPIEKSFAYIEKYDHQSATEIKKELNDYLQERVGLSI